MKKIIDSIILFVLFAVVCMRNGKGHSVDMSKDAVEEPLQNAVSLEDAKSIFPTATELLSRDDGVFEVRQDGKTVGFAMKSTPYSDEIGGFMGPTPLLIALDADAKVCKVVPLPNDETPRFFERVKKSDLFESWNGLTAAEAATKQVDAISGATFSSKSVIESMQARMEFLGKIEPTVSQVDRRALIADCAFVLLLIVALFAYFWPAKIGKLRYAILLASILILAFWQGRILSMAQFMTWLLNGVPFPAQWALARLLCLAILLPMIFGKAFYCSWLCPFGAAQVLLGAVNKKKIKIGAKLLKWLAYLRSAVLIGVLLAMAFGLAIDFASFEPFTVFHPTTAPIVALILGIVSLVLSLFISRPWCRFICPLGALLENVRLPRKKKGR